MKMNQINSVCVYSASSTKIDAVYFQAADTLGYLLAEHPYSFDKMEPEVLA